LSVRGVWRERERERDEINLTRERWLRGGAEESLKKNDEKDCFSERWRQIEKHCLQKRKRETEPLRECEKD